MGLYANKQYLESVKRNDFIKAINEVYFGETPGILRCFETFCEFRDKYITNRLLFTGNIEADHDKDLKRFIEEMEREFGLYSYSFIVVNDDTVNAFTIIPFFRGQDIIEVKNGYRFKKSAEVSMMTFCFTGLLFDSNYTNREIFATILHEIGHNIQDYANIDMVSLHMISNFLIAYNEVLRLMTGDIIGIIKDALTVGFFSNKSVGVLSRLFNNITVMKDNKNIYSYFNFLNGIYSTGKNIFMVPIKITLYPVLTIISGILNIFASILNPINSHKDYLGERFADGFPASYGFGPDIASATVKMGKNLSSNKLEEKVMQIPIVGHLFNIAMLPGQFLIQAGDCHPRSVARAKSVVKDLKEDLKDPKINPKLRKQIEKDVKKNRI